MYILTYRCVGIVVRVSAIWSRRPKYHIRLSTASRVLHVYIYIYICVYTHVYYIIYTYNISIRFDRFALHIRLSTASRVSTSRDRAANSAASRGAARSLEEDLKGEDRLGIDFVGRI